jgi:23S rRNA (cytosine1962-C5)-methyltransferase
VDPVIRLLEAQRWSDYELLDSGDGRKLERFGPYVLDRPEAQSLWRKSLPQSEWNASHAVFISTAEESGGHWDIKRRMDERWQMHYPGQMPSSEGSRPTVGGEGEIRFWAMTTPGRHLGVFPEGAAHWDWMADLIARSGRPIRVLNLFGYTGLATLMAARAGAAVTHVDASRKAVNWARENQSLSGFNDLPVRWIVDDAVKFTQREIRRGAHYDGILLDPPKFGRGPKGEVWEVYKSLPALMEVCRELLSPLPLFTIITVYAVRASAVHLHSAMQSYITGFSGELECGELVTREKGAGRLISNAVYARWSSE